jgi:lipid II:glycine glycyltransferase (peptidoglycan interpeptide bridge formation enzyme)
MWKNQWANDEAYFDEHNNWLGPPNTQAQELRVNFSTQLWNLKKSSQDILPKNTFFIDLNKSEQDLLKDMRPNTRYKIRQSQNQGIVIRTALQASVQDWYKVYAETCQRHGMSQQEQSYFEALIAQHQHGKDEVQVHLLTAEYQDKVIASMFQVICNTRAVYLYGASLSMQGNIRASYALQWASIQFAKSKGCTEYDMFGAAPNMLNPSHPLHGVHKYKKGFGGYLYHRMGCWDYPIHSKIYHAFSMQERQN